jgi:chromate transporter
VILARLAAIMFAVNALSVGGGYAALPLLHKWLVEHQHWLTNKEFVDAIAIGQVTPGPLTVMNAFIGFKVGGLIGAIVAIVASYLPSLLVVSLIAGFYLHHRRSPALSAALAALKPAVVGLLAAVLIFLGHASIVSPATAALAAASFALATFSRLDPSFIIVGAGVLGALLF